MPSFSTFFIATLATTLVSGSPVKLVARDVCGSAPSGSSGPAILSQPSGVNTAADCQTQCEANGSCQSFCFGMVNNANQCILYSVAASAIPQQSSANLLAYDKACPSVPNIAPTASNPTGADTGANGQTTPSNGNTGANGQTAPTNGNTANGQAGTSNGNTATRQSGATNGNSGNSNGGPSANQQTGRKLTARNNCGGAPTGPSGAAPLSTPANIGPQPACLEACKANGSCKSCEFGSPAPGASEVCRLFAVPAASVPAPGSGQSFIVFDVGC